MIKSKPIPISSPLLLTCLFGVPGCLPKRVSILRLALYVSGEPMWVSASPLPPLLFLSPGVWVFPATPITPDGCAGEAPFMEPWCLRLSAPPGPRNCPDPPASMHCSQDERVESVQAPGAVQGRSIPQAGTNLSLGLHLQGLALDHARLESSCLCEAKQEK